jgi:predicted transcriptional regulator
MTANGKTPRPTQSELAILQVLWASGPSTVRQIHESLDSDGTKGYTTTLKTMQIMTEKGLLKRDESARSHVYAAALPPEDTQNQLVDDLIQRAFGGSAKKLVLNALASKQATPEELQDIRILLESMEKDRRR